MTKTNRRVTTTVIVLISLAALFAGIFVAQHIKMPEPVQIHGTLLNKPRSIQPFELTGTDDHKFNNASLKGGWTMVFFGFTNCGSICPTTMAELAKMYKILEEKQVKNMPRVVMVTIDPNRDNLGKLKDYVSAFNLNFYGARGNEESIQHMTRELGIVYARTGLKSAEPEKYEMEHTGTVMLFNPEGELTAFFTMPHQAKSLAKDYQALTFKF
jgi:protein SCO1/2